MKLFSYILAVVLLLAAGCGTEQKSDSKTEISKAAETAGASNDRERIRQALTEMIDRVKEGDKTVLYENEFTYFTDSVSLSAYMEIPRVIDYAYDTLHGIAVDTIKLMDDSALVMARIIYRSVGGGEIERIYPIKVYRSGERWIKPYLSNYMREAEYLEAVKAYREAVGGGGHD